MDNKRTVEEFNDCTSRIIGCAMKVHATLGNGCQEVIYQRALEIGMAFEGLHFESEKEMPISTETVKLGYAGSIFLLKMK